MINNQILNLEVMKILNALDNSQTVVSQTTIPAGSKNYYKVFNNILLETELHLTGNYGTNVFVQHAGVRSNYSPNVKSSQSVTFNQELNQMIFLFL